MKGQISMLQILTVMVGVLVVLLFLIVPLWNTFFSNQDEQSCAAQIRTHESIARFTNGVGESTITCPTRRLIENVKNDDEANKIIADQMAQCWSEWGEGEYELFGREEGMYCHVCSTIQFSGVGQISGLPAYLDNHDAPSGERYSQYLTGTKVGTYFTDSQLASQASQAFPTDKPVAIVFTYAKGYQWYERFRDKFVPDPKTATVGGAGVGFVGGVVAGIIVVKTAPVSVPLIILGTGVLGTTTAGAGSGLVFSIAGTSQASSMSAIVARPLDAKSIEALGCTIAPVSN